MLQRRLSTLLYNCWDDITIATPRQPLAHGFRRHQSIFENAKKHKRRRYVLNIDLTDFFASFNFGRVRGFFISNRDFQLNERTATVIAQLACFKNSLPQGSPSSPVISDMIAHVLDVRLVQLAKAHRVTCSRYADDLTFSTSERLFPTALAYLDTSSREWRLGTELIQTIERAAFRINPDKTRMQLHTGRQQVTGLTVNNKVNIRQDYTRSARAMCNTLFLTGIYHRREPVDESSYKMITDLQPLAGILSHIYHIKSTTTRSKHNGKLPKNVKIPTQHIYAEFLFYQYFVA